MKNPLVVPTQQTPIVIGNISIHQDSEGRYCLNDLHKASGGLSKHKPSEWLRNKQTAELIDELSKAGIPAIQSKQQLGTFAAKDLVYDYAMWISAAFKVKVIRTFDAVVQSQNMPVINDPIIMLRLEQINIQQQLQTQQAQIADHSNKIESMKPSLTASAITTILGAISHTAKLYRQAQSIKHVKVSVQESTEHFRLLLLDKYGVADIGYLSDWKIACKYLQAEAKRYQTVINDWYNRNSLFTGGAV